MDRASCFGCVRHDTTTSFPQGSCTVHTWVYPERLITGQSIIFESNWKRNSIVTQWRSFKPEIVVSERLHIKNYATWGGIHQSSCDEKLEMISSLNILQFTIHSCDCTKSTTQKHDPEILMESWFCCGNFKLKMLWRPTRRSWVRPPRWSNYFEHLQSAPLIRILKCRIFEVFPSKSTQGSLLYHIYNQFLS